MFCFCQLTKHTQYSLAYPEPSAALFEGKNVLGGLHNFKTNRNRFWAALNQ